MRDNAMRIGSSPLQTMLANIRAYVSISVMRKPILLSIMFLLILSCKGQPVPENKKSYVGTWVGDGITLIISSDGGLSYQKVRSAGRTSVHGPIQEFAEREIRAGVWIFSAKFRIDQEPALVDGKWMMEVDGEKLTKLGP